MNTYDQMLNHRSIRKYKPTPIAKELLKKYIYAGLRASSSGNMQSWSVVITTDPNIKKRLFKPHFEQEMVLEAPVLMTFCSDFHRMRQWLENSEAEDNFDNFMSFMIGGIDACLASQNVALAAEAEGLGICYMGTTLASCFEIAQILELPKNVVPIVGYVMGHPDESPNIRDRLPLDSVIHWEKYQDYTSQQIKDIHKERETKGWDRYIKFPDLRKKIEESKVKNLAQIYTQIKYTKESHQFFSQNILKCLNQQDFFNNG